MDDSSHLSQPHSSKVTASGNRGLLRNLNVTSRWNRTRELWPWLRNWIFLSPIRQTMDCPNSSEIHVVADTDCGECPESDRFSELPDALIIEILSLLPMPDVVATMLLSKRWQHLWTTVPYLDFSIYYHQMFHNNLHKYKGFVSGALAHWKGSKSQKLSFTFGSDDDSVVDSWLLFAREKQVEELVVCGGISESNCFEYYPPQRLYSCSSVTKMSLYSCKLRINEAVQWNRLKSLKIDCLEYLSEDAIKRILAGSPLLEELSLIVIEFVENLNIRSTSLKKLKVGLYGGTLFQEVLRIWAPNLLELELYGLFYGEFLLDVPSLTNAKLCFRQSRVGETYAISPPLETFNQAFQRIRHVEKLTLSDFSIKTLLNLKHNDFVVRFSNTKTLYLYTGEVEEMLGVLDMFPNLTTLWVQLDRDVYSHLEEEEEEEENGLYKGDVSKEDLPSPSVLYLKTVEITWFMRDVSIIPATEILLEKAKLLNKLVFRPLWYGDNREVLLSTPASSPTAEVIIAQECSKHAFLYGRSSLF